MMVELIGLILWVGQAIQNECRCSPPKTGMSPSLREFYNDISMSVCDCMSTLFCTYILYLNVWN